MDDQMFLFLQVLTFINIQYVEKKLLLWGKKKYIYTRMYGASQVVLVVENLLPMPMQEK